MANEYQTVRQQAEAIESGDLDPRDRLEAALTRAEQSRSVFIRLLGDRARFEAEQAARRRRADRRLSPLDGVPIAWKDVFDMRDTVTTGGSRLFSDTAVADAETVRNTGQAGLVSLGKTNMTELAYSGLGINPHYGTPHATPGQGPARVPGGSSSGSAVAVAQGIVAAATGSDTAGSLRIPAAFNGLVSYRSTIGRQPMGGVLPLARTLDTVGVLAHTLTDCLMVDDAMRGGRVTRYTPRRPEQITLVLDAGALDDPFISQAVRDNTLACAQRYAAAGARVVRKPVPAVREALDCIRQDGWLGGFEAYTEYKTLLETRPEADFDPRVRNRLLSIAQATPDCVVRLYRARRRLQRALREQLDGALLLSPTVAHVAPELAPLLGDDDRYVSVNLATLKLTMVASMLDCPAIALPSGTDSEGQHTSVQLSAPAGDDDLLIRSALALAP